MPPLGRARGRKVAMVELRHPHPGTHTPACSTCRQTPQPPAQRGWPLWDAFLCHSHWALFFYDTLSIFPFLSNLFHISCPMMGVFLLLIYILRKLTFNQSHTLKPNHPVSRSGLKHAWCGDFYLRWQKRSRDEHRGTLRSTFSRREGCLRHPFQIMPIYQ